MTNEPVKRMCRVKDFQLAMGYEHQHAARRMLERLDKRGVIKLRRVGRAVFLSIDELNTLLGIDLRSVTTPPPPPERAAG
jgi:hypothetical protein